MDGYRYEVEYTRSRPIGVFVFGFIKLVLAFGLMLIATLVQEGKLVEKPWCKTNRTVGRRFFVFCIMVPSVFILDRSTNEVGSCVVW